MGNDRIRELLDELSEELQTTSIDPETAHAMQRLDDDLRLLLRTSSDSTNRPSVIEQAQKMEVRFATSHPTAEKLVQEVIDILSKAGI